MAANSVLAKMAVQISANNADFARAMNKSQKDLHNFTTGVTKIAGVLGVAFGVQQIASFALEVSRLAGEAKAVREAFETLPQSTKLMMDLKEATGGTVSELDLMKRAVQASNFGISLQALPKLLEFATLRAQQTGQSVDYLVDSIVTGIGRKSKLILDNLGISAVQLNEALGDTAIGAASIGDVADAVGRIIDDNLSKMNEFSENSSTKLQRLTASWVNLKVAIGEAANETGVLGAAIDATTGTLDILASRDLTFLEKFKGLFGMPGSMADAALKIYLEQLKKANEEQKKQEQVIREVDRAFKEFSGDIDAYGRAITTHVLRSELLEEFTKRITKAEDDRITTVGELRAVEKELLATREGLSVTDAKGLELNTKQIAAIRERIAAIDDQLKKEKELAAHTLSQTAQRAIAGGGVNGVTTAAGMGTTIPVDSDAAIAKMEGFRNKSAEVTEEVAQDFLDMSGIVAGSLVGLAQGLGAAITGTENFGDTILQTIGGFMQSFGASLIALGIGKLALEKFSGPEMIAAGFVLTAAGSALAASISKGPSLSGGGSGRSGGARFAANSFIQNSSPQLITVLKGEDVWIMLQNYETGKRYTGG